MKISFEIANGAFPLFSFSIITTSLLLLLLWQGGQTLTLYLHKAIEYIGM